MFVSLKCLPWEHNNDTYVQPLQSDLTLCNPMDHIPPGSPVHGIFLAKILEKVAIPSSRGSSWPSNPVQVSCVSCIAGGFFTLESSQGSWDSERRWREQMSSSLELHFFPFLLLVLYEVDLTEEFQLQKHIEKRKRKSHRCQTRVWKRTSLRIDCKSSSPLNTG